MIKNIYKKYRTVITYFLSSGSSFIIDILLFTVFMHVINNIILAGYLARVISSFVNYLINKYVVFKSNKSKSKTLFGYFSLVIINITISNVFVSLINTNTHFNATLIKVIIDSAIFISNYFIQKYLIFKTNINEKLSKYIIPFITFISLFVHLNSHGLVFDYNIYDYTIMLVSIIILYYLFFKLFDYKNNDKFSILSIIFSIFMIVGYSYSKTYTLSLVYHTEIHILINLIKFFGYYYFFKYIMNYIYKFIINTKYKDLNDNIVNIFKKHPFIYSFIIIFIIYTGYLICFYPGVINYDNANQIKEVMGIHNRYLDSIIVINKNITLTNFNPIIHTLLLGNFFKLGVQIGNVNLGLFIYTFIQMIIVVLIYAYSILFLVKENIKIKYVLIVLLLYIVLPYYPFYSITCVKDTYWTSFFLLYLIKLYQLYKYKFKIRDYLVLIGTIILLILFRNNGIVPILCSLPILIIYKKRIMKNIVLLVLFTFIFTIGYTRFLKLVQIPNTSPREALSVPFQQTARYVRDYPNDVLDDEKEVIDKILNYQTLAKRYNPELSDKVKNKYNIYTTKSDLIKYFNVWFRMFFRHPDAYLNSLLSNSYGYIYPDSYGWYIYCNLNKKLQEAGFDYHFNKLIIPRVVLIGEAMAFTKIPLLNLFVSCGMWTWVYIFLLAIIKRTKQTPLVFLLTPVYSLIFMCLIGPANTYFRYVYSYAAVAPIIVLLIIKSVNKTIINVDKK